MNISYQNAEVPKAMLRIIAQRGMKQCTVAERMGITPQMLCDMLYGRRLIKPIDIVNAAKALDVMPNDLFVGEAQQKPA